MDYEEKSFYWYDMPDGRTPESYAYKIEEMWGGRETDTLYTDDPDEAERIIEDMLEGLYDVRVTHCGTETMHRAPRA